MSEQVNLYDTANQLEREIRQSDQYQNLKEAIAAVKADDEARQIFDRSQSLQKEISEYQLQGQEVDPAVIQEIQELTQKMPDNELLAELMQAEQEVNMLINDLNRIILDPVSDLYE